MHRARILRLGMLFKIMAACLLLLCFLELFDEQPSPTCLATSDHCVDACVGQGGVCTYYWTCCSESCRTGRCE
jgi:hypothetical protein